MTLAAHSRRGFLGGAFLRARAAPKPAVALVANIQPAQCLSGRGGVCTVCMEQCPVPGVLRADGFRITVDEARCTGCARCQQACPAPYNAIIMWPGARMAAKP